MTGTRRALGAIAFALALGAGSAVRAAPSQRNEQLTEASRRVAEVDTLLLEQRYDEALGAGAEALAVREKLVGPNTWEVADVLHRLARVHVRRGAFAKAEAALLRAVAIAEQLMPTLSPTSFFPLFAELAELHERMGLYPRAEADYQREIAVRQRENQGPVFLWVPRRGLARVYVAEGRYAEAEQIFQEAITFYEEYDSASYRVIFAECLVGLASILRVRGDYARAEQLLQQAVTLATRNDIGERSKLAAALEELGRLSLITRDVRSAAALLTQLLALRSDKLGP
ncbi:MAG: tetratricopeptide repeat protein, partial [Minicystis sp.]